MRFISIDQLQQHPEVRKERFAKSLWPDGRSPKAVEEGWILLEFLNAAGLLPESGPRELQPPMPDCECVVGGRRILFELGEILESDFAEGLAFSTKQSRKKTEAAAAGDLITAASIPTAGFRSFTANGSLERILRKKLATRYEVTGDPCQLLLFYDQQTPWGPFEYLFQWEDELARLIAESVFERVWIFSLRSAVILGYLEPTDDRKLRTLHDARFCFDLNAPFEALVPPVDGRPDEIRLFKPVVTSARGGQAL